MNDQPDLFTWIKPSQKTEAVVIDALPKLLTKIRIEKTYGKRRPTGEAIVLPLQRRSA
ncbi:hypothetical protein M8R20_10600 [Pseudomonas sp. R2.Fl]|nr:hypothetical protein [Pseudomonas sp. R2.Fl]